MPCGTGIRRRQAICTLETQERNLDHRSPSENGVTRRLEAFSTVVTVNRMRVEVADHELCYKHNLPIPVEEEACFEGPCPQWVADDWGPVSYKYVTGLKTIYVHGMKKKDEYFSESTFRLA